MFDFSSLGRLLLIAGILIALAGIALLLAGKIPWLGRLPGDFYHEGKGYSFYFPLTTGLIVSLVVSLLIFLFNRRP